VRDPGAVGGEADGVIPASERLAELTDAGLLDRDEAGAYRLTDLGAALGPALESLDSWARQWSAALQEKDRQRSFLNCYPA